MLRSIAALLTLLLLQTASAEAACSSPLLDTQAKRLIGPAESLCQYAGKAVLVVNTASHCGFTPQYEGLEALWKEYGDDGLVVLGFPSDQFGGQEFGDDAQIAKFCKLNFGVSFPMFSKSAVKGEGAIPLFRNLIEATGEAPSWNFHKYLIAADGKTVQTFSSRVGPNSKQLRKAIEAALPKDS